MLRRALFGIALIGLAGHAQAGEGNYGVNTYALAADTANSGYNYAGYNAQLQGGPFGVIATGRYGSQILSGMGDPVTTVGTQSGTISANSYLTAATDQATTTRPGDGTGTAFASADLATGILRAAASGEQYGVPANAVVGRSLAQFGDGLTFNIPGATASTITDIGFTVRTDGLFGGGVGFDAANILAGLSVDQAGYGDAQYLGGYGFTNEGPPKMEYDTHSGWVSYDFTGGPGDYTFSGVFAAHGADAYLTFGDFLEAGGNNGFADYANTSRLSLQLPTGVTFTSDSDVLLTQSGVPEPSLWMVMLGGIGLAGSAIRRRRALRPRVAA